MPSWRKQAGQARGHLDNLAGIAVGLAKQPQLGRSR